MKDRNVNEFIDTLSIGMEITFVNNEQTFLIEGSSDENGWSAFLVRIEPPADYDIWSAKGPTMAVLAEEFLKAKIFDGKDFWEIENEIDWIYG